MMMTTTPQQGKACGQERRRCSCVRPHIRHFNTKGPNQELQNPSALSVSRCNGRLVEHASQLGGRAITRSQYSTACKHWPAHRGDTGGGERHSRILRHLMHSCGPLESLLAGDALASVGLVGIEQEALVRFE
eukprot:UN3922